MYMRNFGMGFFGRGHCDDARKNFMEEWAKKSVEEKIDFVDKRMEAMGRAENCLSGFFDHVSGHLDRMRNEWEKMSADEKAESIRKREEAMKEGKFPHDGHFGGDRFSIENIDERCEAWMKMTPEEKEEFINEKKEMMSERHFRPGGFGGRGCFGFGFGGENNCR
jgi:predicted Fe-S protein YdhL (DUF1289 family)